MAPFLPDEELATSGVPHGECPNRVLSWVGSPGVLPAVSLGGYGWSSVLGRNVRCTVPSSRFQRASSVMG
jgi:hypothetical protein